MRETRTSGSVEGVLSNGHPYSDSSRVFFGAMTFALEEVFLHNPDNLQVRERARALFDQVRTAFIAHHAESTPGFQPPPTRPEDDPLNDWVGLPAGHFVMESVERDSDEQPTRTVHLAGFFMQRHEVTNEEYWSSIRRIPFLPARSGTPPLG